jgi:hypothetical protein
MILLIDNLADAPVPVEELTTRIGLLPRLLYSDPPNLALVNGSSGRGD